MHHMIGLGPCMCVWSREKIPESSQPVLCKCWAILILLNWFWKATVQELESWGQAGLIYLQCPFLRQKHDQD